jgi:hypothetical protein
MVEINLNLETRYVGGMSINDMVNQFGWRIRKAVVYEHDKPVGLSSIKMVKLMRWWKSWNKDIRKAYKDYTGLLYVPWTIEYEPITDMYYNADIDWNKLEEEVLKGYPPEVLEKYTDKQINPKFYSELKIVRDDD